MQFQPGVVKQGHRSRNLRVYSHDVVLGAGGKTGKYVVQKLAEKGRAVKAVVRDPSKYSDLFKGSKNEDLIELVAGDVTQNDSFKPYLDGARGVVFAAQGDGEMGSIEVENQGLRNVTDECKQSSVERLVVVTSMLVDPKNKDNPTRQQLNSFRKDLMDNKFYGEEYVRESGVDYTIVRPGGLTMDDGLVKPVVFMQGDKRTLGRIPREDVGMVCAMAFESPEASKKTFEVFTDPAAMETDPSPTPIDETYLLELYKGLKAEADIKV